MSVTRARRVHQPLGQRISCGSRAQQACCARWQCTLWGRFHLVLVAAALVSVDVPCRAAPEEIQVYVDDLSPVGGGGVDIHNNYVPSSSAVAEYSGQQTPEHVYRLTPEFYYGYSKTTELGLYVLGTDSTAFGPQYAGVKIRIKYIAPHDEKQGMFWGGNLEVGDTRRLVSEVPWNVELKGIVGLRAGSWLLAANTNLDRAAPGYRSPTTFDLDLKVARAVSSVTQLGFESYTDLLSVGCCVPHRPERSVYAVIDTALGAADLNAGIGRGLTASTDGWILKAIIGFRFGR